MIWAITATEEFKSFSKVQQRTVRDHLNKMNRDELLDFSLIPFKLKIDTIDTYSKELHEFIFKLVYNLEIEQFQKKHELFFEEYTPGKEVVVAACAFYVQLHDDYFKPAHILERNWDNKRVAYISFRTECLQEIICRFAAHDEIDRFKRSSVEGWFNLRFIPKIIHRTKIFIYTSPMYQLETI